MKRTATWSEANCSPPKNALTHVAACCFFHKMFLSRFFSRQVLSQGSLFLKESLSIYRLYHLTCFSLRRFLSRFFSHLVRLDVGNHLTRFFSHNASHKVFLSTRFQVSHQVSPKVFSKKSTTWIKWKIYIYRETQHVKQTLFHKPWENHVWDTLQEKTLREPCYIYRKPWETPWENHVRTYQSKKTATEKTHENQEI